MDSFKLSAAYRMGRIRANFYNQPFWALLNLVFACITTGAFRIFNIVAFVFTIASMYLNHSSIKRLSEAFKLDEDELNSSKKTV